VGSGVDAQHRAALDLVHDVGKRIARVARNLPDGPVSQALVDMLVADLYALDEARRASEVFAARAAALRGWARNHVDACGSWLEEIDALEPSVRAGDLPSVRRAAELATRVEAELRALLNELGDGSS
jgi:hypothetical protein